jgi:hypothetical protein
MILQIGYAGVAPPQPAAKISPQGERERMGRKEAEEIPGQSWRGQNLVIFHKTLPFVYRFLEFLAVKFCFVCPIQWWGVYSRQAVRTRMNIGDFEGPTRQGAVMRPSELTGGGGGSLAAGVVARWLGGSVARAVTAR